MGPTARDRLIDGNYQLDIRAARQSPTPQSVWNDASSTISGSTSASALFREVSGHEPLVPGLTVSEPATEYTQWSMRGALPDTANDVRQQAGSYHALADSPRSETFPAHTIDPHRDPVPPDPDSCPLPYQGAFDDDADDDFEPVDDQSSLPRLDFKPFVLRPWTLAVVIFFYASILAGLATLYYYENKARVFHVRATASRFTIRILPSLIGTVSTIIFQAVASNYARIWPYIAMAQPVVPAARETILASHFPLFNIFHALSNRHVRLTIGGILWQYVNPFITPAKSTLIHKTPSEDDPNSWTVTISSGAALYLMFNYAAITCLTISILVSLHKRWTGLKWDPVSVADHITLLQGSDLLDDFSGLEYHSSSFFLEAFRGKPRQFHALNDNRYRLGYWRHRPTNRYWHGIRKWPARYPGSGNQGSLHEQGKTSSRLRKAETRPAISDKSPEARAWWRTKCKEVLEDPARCYSGVYFWIHDYTAIGVFSLVTVSAAAGLWTIFTGHLESGFTFPKTSYRTAYFVLTFVPTFWFGLVNPFWYQIDIWYRQLQMFMSLRQPSNAAENLLLGYPCDLPVVVTVKALAAAHWRLALTSSMSLIHKLMPVLAGSSFTVDLTASPDQFHVVIARTQFKVVVGMLCTYIVLIPMVWPGLDRRLPHLPVCIANVITLFYDSTLVRDSHNIFLPQRHMNEERWHMEYRLCLAERKYGFGVYPGRNGALHIGIDDVYGYGNDDTERELRFVAPLLPPKRLYRRLLKSLWVGTLRKLNVKRQPTLKEEELDVLQRLHSDIQSEVTAKTTAVETVTGHDAVSNR